MRLIAPSIAICVALAGCADSAPKKPKPDMSYLRFEESRKEWEAVMRDAYADHLKIISGFVGKPLWARRTEGAYIRPNGDLLGGTVTIRNLERVELVSADLGVTNMREHVIITRLRLGDGREVFAHYIRPSAAVDFRLSWHTSDPVAVNADITSAEWEAIRSGSYALGMREKVVRLMLGPPQEINRTRMRGFDMEQYVYSRPDSGKLRMLYFRDGELVAIQD